MSDGDNIGKRLTVKNLAYEYRYKPLFSGLSFDLHQNELIWIKGSNGVGKSTLMRLLLGLLPLQKGEVNYHSYGSDPRSFIHYLSAESHGLIEELSAVENLKLFSNLRRGGQRSYKDPKASLDDWGLTQKHVRLGFAVGRFSTGMKKRLALARLFSHAGKESVLLADEPLFGLDVEGKDKFQTHAQYFLRNGGAMLMINHDEVFMDAFAKASGYHFRAIDLKEFAR